MRSAAALVLLLAGCAHRATYVPLDRPLPDAPQTSEGVESSVAFLMDRGRMPRLTWSPVAGAKPLEVGRSELDRVPTEALWMAWVCSPRRMWGSELDVLVPTEGGPVPMTVQIDLEGSVHLVRGRDAPEPEATRTDLEAWAHEIAQRYGLGGVVDGTVAWTAQELDVVVHALDLLGPEELDILDGLVLVRDATSPRHPRELALYDPLGSPVRISVFDGAFAAGAWSFVGDVGDPRPAAVMTLVHEFGHVISDAPVAASYERLADARSLHLTAAPADRGFTRAHLRVARRDLRHVGPRGPVIRQWAHLRAGRLWPTTWSTDVYESFAEAFALYRTDPDALMRVAPEAHQWFEDQGHLAWRGIGD